MHSKYSRAWELVLRSHALVLFPPKNSVYIKKPIWKKFIPTNVYIDMIMYLNSKKMSVARSFLLVYFLNDRTCLWFLSVFMDILYEHFLQYRRLSGRFVKMNRPTQTFWHGQSPFLRNIRNSNVTYKSNIICVVEPLSR